MSEFLIATLAEYCAELAEVAMRDFPTLDTVSTMRVIHLAHGSADGDGDENYSAMLSAAVATLASSTATVHDIGTVAPLRADHLKITDRPFDSEASSGTVKASDPFHAVTTATVKRSRGKKGTSTTVTRHGRSLLTAGDTYPTVSTDSIVPAVVVDHALEQCRGPLGFDAIGVARVATFAYDLPALIGGEFTSWSEVLPTDVSHLMATGMVGTHSTGSYDGNTRHNVTLKAWPTRYKVPTQRARKGENFEPCTVNGVTLLHAPTDRADRRFVGHGAIGRPVTVHAQRRTRQYSEAFTLTGDHLANLIAIASTVNRGKAATWRTSDGSIRGTVSVSPKGRYSATVQGVNISVKGAKTPQGLARQLAPAFN